MGLNDWFEKGLNTDEYIGTLDKHKEGFSHIYEQFTLPSEDEQFFDSLKKKNLRVIVLAEPWCGHCMLNIPVLFHLAEKVDMPVRVLLRDENLELMDQYLTNGKSRTIPIFIFIDGNGNEVAKWGPIADTTKQFIAPLRAELPDKEAEDYEEKFQALIKITAEAFKENTKLWNGSYDSMKQTLQKLL